MMQIGKIPENEPYFMVAVCVCFIGNNSDVLLLQKRSNHPLYPGLWGFPAGKKQTKDRTLQHAACRELHEETGNNVPISMLCQFGLHAYQHHKPDGEPFYFIARSFYLSDYVLPGFRRNKAEHQAALIVPAAEIFRLNAKCFIPDSLESFAGLYEKLKETKRI